MSASSPNPDSDGLPSWLRSPITWCGVAVLGIWMAVFFLSDDESAGRVAVRGRITLDGKPVEAGSVSFIPSPQTNGPSASGKIAGGRYSLSAKEGPGLGEYRLIVQIQDSTAPARAAQTPPRPRQKPEIAGVRHERPITTQAGEDNEFNFDLSETP